MIWVLLMIAGLVVEVALIVVLGRQVTGPDEEATHPDRLGPPVVDRT